VQKLRLDARLRRVLQLHARACCPRAAAAPRPARTVMADNDARSASAASADKPSAACTCAASEVSAFKPHSRTRGACLQRLRHRAVERLEQRGQVGLACHGDAHPGGRRALK